MTALTQRGFEQLVPLHARVAAVNNKTSSLYVDHGLVLNVEPDGSAVWALRVVKDSECFDLPLMDYSLCDLQQARQRAKLLREKAEGRMDLVDLRAQPQADAKGSVRLVEPAEPASIVQPDAVAPRSRGGPQRTTSSELVPPTLSHVPTPREPTMEQAKVDVLSWDTVFARWATHGVPLVTVVDKQKDLCERRWLNKAGTEFAREFENFTRDTANLLQAGKVTATPEKFCAFALLAVIRQSGTHLEYDDVRRRLWVLAHALCLGQGGGDFWHWRATKVLPGTPIEIYGLLRQDDVRWNDWVDVAAQTWKRIAADHSVARYARDESDEG